MSKRPLGRAAQKSKAVLRRHVSELVNHTVEVSRYGGHGHAEGRQGRAGHGMPKSNLNAQTGAHLPQNIDGDNCRADDASTRNYGIVDAGD
jgi:hypothetical protein